MDNLNEFLPNDLIGIINDFTHGDIDYHKSVFNNVLRDLEWIGGDISFHKFTNKYKLNFLGYCRFMRESRHSINITHNATYCSLLHELTGIYNHNVYKRFIHKPYRYLYDL